MRAGVVRGKARWELGAHVSVRAAVAAEYSTPAARDAPPQDVHPLPGLTALLPPVCAAFSCSHLPRVLFCRLGLGASAGDPTGCLRHVRLGNRAVADTRAAVVVAAQVPPSSVRS